ncbi:MAG TPA: cytochrome c biogenesis protein CcdA [Dehalococcoidia bacterium]|jgi:cytochrome c-type biogenesis protein|nr:cytochrome c biogenesis protein CcdA [Dehalococcoidia bacterium]
MLTEGWVDYLTGPFGIAFAFAAGVISFLSPCVLPLVPAYIAHLTGVASDPEATAGRRETMSHALAFVTGFGVVFTAIGASVGLVGGFVADQMPTLEKIAGVFLIVLGLNLMGVLKIPWLYRTYTIGSGTSAGGGSLAYAGAGAGGGTTTLVTVQSTALSYARSFGFGSSFAIAWTPCIGPVLGAILTLAAASSTVYQGAYLLLAYSAGLAVPFLIAGFAVGSVTAGLRRFGRFMPMLEMGAGAIVVLIGVLIFLNEFTSLNQYFDLIPELNGV